ncbi:MAG: DUF2625 domain-containing protein [Mucilaginibacter sp.]|nr:DUF2625 domain-containing protein [Mucilaginibacter sp.]
MKQKALSFKIFAILFFLLNAVTVFAQNKIRTVEELTSDTSGWDSFKENLKIARNKIEILPVDRAKAKLALYNTQVTTHSIMGAVIYFTGGILVDNGWIRILGSGNEKLTRSLPDWNKGKTFNELGEQPKFLLVADDVIGGFFAINGGALGGEVGKVYYLAPDDLKWESLHIGYTDFINLCLVGNMDQFYSGLRWKGWENDLKNASGNNGFYIYPYPWTKEGKDIEKDTKKIVPIQELYDFETNEIKQTTK